MFSNKDVLSIVPDKTQTLTEQLNTVMRFTIYFSVIMWIIQKDARVVYLVVFVAMITYIINTQNELESTTRRELFDKLNMTEDLKKRACVLPSKNNPFMNVNYLDYTDFPNRPRACKMEDVKEEVANNFEIGLHRLENDVYKNTASDRQFFTNPNTTIPNDQTSFAEWLYKTGPTLKERTAAA
jgi:hypothetical protein